MHRRNLLELLVATGLGTPSLHRAISVLTDSKDGLTVDALKQAEWITDVSLDDTQRETILTAVNRHAKTFKELREIELPATLPPALNFQTASSPKPVPNLTTKARPAYRWTGGVPGTPDEIAFLPIAALSSLIRCRKISSVELTQLYLERLKKYSPMLRCTVTLTEELAMRQAKEADAEIKRGKYRGPLHGIPWGAKDLISVPNYPTTWGIPHLKQRVLDETATVVEKLEAAGAVLVAKLSLGALAMGDKWFGGTTRNPWNPRVGSSGSSAGSASATAAGLVGFSLGSETLGSITSPAKRCGVTGFRPTFGRVSRYGCMPLSWSMDKIGPICRSVDDCALVFAAIHGADRRDPTANDAPFQWPKKINLKGVKVGFQTVPRRSETDRPDLKILEDLGCQLVPLGPPPAFDNHQALATIIDIEGASVFDSLLRDGHTEGWNAWETIFQSAQYISAIDYLRLQRLRTRLIEQFEEYIEPVDALVNVSEIFHTNLAGHPSVVLPRDFRDEGKEGAKRPIPLTLTGHLNQDDQLLALAHSVQTKLNAHHQRPALNDWKAKFETGQLDTKQKVKPRDAEKPVKPPTKTGRKTAGDK